jgi:hypothetical protein
MAPSRRIIVSGSSSGYFGLLQGCVASIRDKPEGAAIALGILDVGLEEPQRAWLAARGAEIVEPGWDFDFPGQAEAPRHRQALFARPFLPRHFPGHDLYLWIDADAWVQDWAAVELFFRAASDGTVALVPEIDRSYRNFFHAWEEFHAVNHEAYREAFDGATADRLMRHPLLNAGVFAAAADAPHWRAWAKILAEALQRSRNALIDQTTLNYMVYVEGLKASFLPARCNWICHHAPPIRLAPGGPLLEPALPHERLAILHLTLWMKERLDLRYPGKTEAEGGERWPSP